MAIGTFSVVAAYILWKIGGNAAKVMSDNPAVGITFELGGAIAGFASVFYILRWAFKEFHELQPPLRSIKVFLIPRKHFAAQDTYSCKVWIYDDEVGEERTQELTPRREAGFLTILLRNMRQTETFRIELFNSQNKSWQSEYCHVAASRAEMQPK